MAQFILSDIFIGEFPISQYFGSNPSWYKQYGIGGHNGLDFACPINTQIVSANDGQVVKVAYDAGGYGNYVIIYHPNGNYLTLYAHLSKAVVVMGQRVIRGQLIAYSGNTGNVYPKPSALQPNNGAHLHFAVAPCDSVGNKTEANNGFSGWIDPFENRVVWQTRKLTAPAKVDVTYQHGGWYDNPATGKNQRWWVFPDKIAMFLPVGLSEPNWDMLVQHSGWQHGAWYDNPLTGQNQRWWCENGSCNFLPVGMSEPPKKEEPPTTPPIGGQQSTDHQSETIRNLNTRITQLEGELLAARTNESIAKGRAETAEAEVTRLTETYTIEHNLRVQAEHSRDICLNAQTKQNQQMSFYKKTSMHTANVKTLLITAFQKLFEKEKGGVPTDGKSTTTSTSTGAKFSSSDSTTKTTP